MPTTSQGTRTAFDDDNDGTIDRTAFDTDGDGTPDRIDHYTIDDDGTRRLTRTDFDLDDDGTIDRTAHLNADGRWERVELDADDDGTIDRIDHYTFDDDGTRSLTRTAFDVDDDGTIDRSERYTLDGDGNRIRTRFDDDNDGTVDRIGFDTDGDGNISRIAHLNADGRWERVEEDVDDDGTIDRIDHYRFDDDGTRSLTRTGFDLDDDGTIDRTAHLNADGRWERVEEDVDDDGTIDRIDHYTFDDAGTRSLTRTAFDVDDDGIIDRSEAYIHDADGNRTRTRFDDDNDGTVDRIGFDTDGDGNISRIAHLNADGRWERVELDADDDGNIDRIDHYTFDDDGARSLTRIDFDVDDDGNIDRIEAYIHDRDGNRIRTRFDDDNDGRIDRVALDPDGDGTPDRIDHYTFDDDGTRSLTRIDFDLDDDGNIDRTAHVNADGRWERVELDVDDDGNIDRIDHYRFADDGTRSLTRTGFDVDDDGIIDRSEAYIHDGDGNRIRTRFDDDNDGRIDRAALDPDGDGNINRIAHLNADGRWERVERDVDDDGTIDRIDHYTFDDDGNRTRTDFDDDNDGTIDRSEAYFYTNGRLIRTEFDDDADGTIDRFNHDRIPLSTLDGSNGFILNGIDANDYSGFSVSSAGDVNGDGYDDLIIGAPWAGPNGGSSGETYLVYGGASAPGTGGVLDLSDLDGTNGFTLTGIDEDDLSGRSVSSAGDVNGDGYDDLIIGAWFADPNGDSNAGETYVVYGGANAPGTGGRFNLSSLDGTNGFTLTGIDAGDLSGFSVSSAGDVNGDGYDDLIIGADGADPNGIFGAGETYIVYGGASAPGTGGRFNLSTLNGTNGFILTGIDAFDQSGRSVSSAGDVNGDGYDDLIIGAPWAEPNGGGSGETYVVYGGANAPGTDGVLDLSDLDGSNGFTLTGIDVFDQSGLSVSSAGDVNGDGYDDLIIGARGADPNGDSRAGETYVVHGGATGTESLVPVMASGTAAADNFTGNAGADSFTDIATNDVVRGGAGDDVIRVTALDFAAIDGGMGRDTLVLDGAGLSLDLTGAGHAGVDSVEVLDLSGTGASTLVLDALAVFDLTEEREGGVASLDVLGNADDSVDPGGSNFALTGTVTEDGTTYNVYRDGNAQLRVEDGVSVACRIHGGGHRPWRQWGWQSRTDRGS